jgi:hypothetical protein
MDVRDQLGGSFTVRKEEVQAFATERRAPQAVAKTLGSSKQARSEIGSKLAEAREVLLRNDKEVAGVDWDVGHERDDFGVTIDEARWLAARNDSTENAVGRYRQPSRLAAQRTGRSAASHSASVAQSKRPCSTPDSIKGRLKRAVARQLQRLVGRQPPSQTREIRRLIFRTPLDHRAGGSGHHDVFRGSHTE